MGGNGGSHFLGGSPGIALEHLGGFNVFCQLLTPDLWGNDPIGRANMFFKWVAFTQPTSNLFFWKAPAIPRPSFKSLLAFS